MCIKIRSRSFYIEDFYELEKSLKIFCVTLSGLGLYELNLSEAIPLPVEKKLLTVNRSVHADNKARDQFFLITHKRLWVLRVRFAEDAQANDISLFEGDSFLRAWITFTSEIDFDWTLEKKASTFLYIDLHFLREE